MLTVILIVQVLSYRHTFYHTVPVFCEQYPMRDIIYTKITATLIIHKS